MVKLTVQSNIQPEFHYYEKVSFQKSKNNEYETDQMDIFI